MEEDFLPQAKSARVTDLPAFVLAGGMGTRLRSVWKGPKALAPVAGKPFLYYLLLTCPHFPHTNNTQPAAAVAAVGK